MYIYHTSVYTSTNAPCDARRREKVGIELYNTVSGLISIISRAYPSFLSPVPWNNILALAVV